MKKIRAYLDKQGILYTYLEAGNTIHLSSSIASMWLEVSKGGGIDLHSGFDRYAENGHFIMWFRDSDDFINWLSQPLLSIFK